ncbi:MAG: poly(A) polymerase [Arenicella sp.]
MTQKKLQATIISAVEAGISNKNISPKALKVVEGLQDAGYQAYLVGGCVRDLIIGTKPKDFDVSTNATPEQIKKAFGRNARIIGRRFKIVHVRFGYEVIEVATFRADANDRERVGQNEMSEGDQGQLLRDNVYGQIEEDVVRRDFTVNAMYYDSVKGEILDFMNGIDDLKAGKLKSIGKPELRFTEDPVRMLRVIRFAGKLGFEMEPEALTMIEEQGKLLSHVSNARLFEEVLKLFHGGAAYETYLLLRKYGLFKYLFPFTDQTAIDGVEGLPERALQNTDKRVKEGKPVIPAFLFACMMWDPVKADAQILMDDGANEVHAWRVAMNDGLRDQNQYVAVPRRLAEIILDIWNIHFRLIKRNPRMVKACLSNRRFRAAYDFLLLRTMMHEVDEEISEWWTEIQELEPNDRETMISDLNASYKQERQPRQSSNEPDGNSVDYNSVGNDDNFGNTVFGDGYEGGFGKPGAAKKSQNQQNRGQNKGGTNSSGRSSKAKPGGQRGRQQNAAGGQQKNTGRGRRPNNPNPGNDGQTGNTNANPGNSDQPSNARRGKAGKKRSSKKHTNNGGQRGNGPNANRQSSRGRTASEPRFQEARPADEFGVTSSASSKKVKVRHKRKVVGPSDNDDKPILG